MNTRLFQISKNTILIVGGLCLLAWAESARAETMPPGFTNIVVRSQFKELGRDPFCPVGYIKPAPVNSSGNPKTPDIRPAVSFKLKVTGILALGDQISATLDNGQTIEPGGEYPYKADDGKSVVTYKVSRITEDSVVVNFDGKDFEFKLSNQDMDMFKEKEDR